MKGRPLKIFIFLCLIIIICQGFGQTLGLIEFENYPENGYLIFSPYKGDTTYLLDRCGRKVHQWAFKSSSGSFPYLQNDGSVIRASKIPSPEFANGNIGGLIERVDWDGNLIWSYQYSDDTVCQHHDIEPMPNGNVLIISYQKHNYEDAKLNGRNPENIDGGL